MVLVTKSPKLSFCQGVVIFSKRVNEITYAGLENLYLLLSQVKSNDTYGDRLAFSKMMRSQSLVSSFRND